MYIRAYACCIVSDGGYGRIVCMRCGHKQIKNINNNNSTRQTQAKQSRREKIKCVYLPPNPSIGNMALKAVHYNQQANRRKMKWKKKKNCISFSLIYLSRPNIVRLDMNAKHCSHIFNIFLINYNYCYDYIFSVRKFVLHAMCDQNYDKK